MADDIAQKITALVDLPVVAADDVFAIVDDPDGPGKKTKKAKISAVNRNFIRTTAEISAGVTPVDFSFEPGNVKRFDAKGDGSTDDTTAVQNTIKSRFNGGIVFFPPGIYILNTQITIPFNVPIILQGSGMPERKESVATGTEVRSLLRDGTSPAIKMATETFDNAAFTVNDMLISGGTFTEQFNIINGPTALGNNIGLDVNSRLSFTMNRVRISGFDDAGLKMELCFYGSVNDCKFRYNGIGADVLFANTFEFRNCHFQLNTLHGSRNIKISYSCAWEANGRSGCVLDEVVGAEYSFFAPFFEANAENDVAGDADILCDDTNFPASIDLYGPHFSSERVANVNAFHHIAGRCTSINLYGALRVFTSLRGNVTYKLGTQTTVYDYTGHPITQSIASPPTLFSRPSISAGGYNKISANDTTINQSTATIEHGAYKFILMTASGGALDVTDITGGYRGKPLVLKFNDSNITMKDNTGNLRLAGDFATTPEDMLELAWDGAGQVWNEKTRSVN